MTKGKAILATFAILHIIRYISTQTPSFAEFNIYYNQFRRCQVIIRQL